MATISCNTSIASLQSWSKDKDIRLPPNQIYTIILDYLFDELIEVEINTGIGLGVYGIMILVGQEYKKLFDSAEKESKIIKNLAGKEIDLNDLWLEEVHIDMRMKRIRVEVIS